MLQTLITISLLALLTAPSSVTSGPSWEIFDVLADRYVSWYDEHRALALSELEAFKEATRGLGPPCADIGAGHGFFTPGDCIAVEPRHSGPGG